jgi:Family of unknown function (DUF6338)
VDTSSVPAILLLLLPGFVALQVFNSVSHKRRLSDLESVLWILLSAFALLFPTVLVWHRLDEQVPSIGSVIRHPESLPVRIAGTLYLLAAPAGFLAGRLDLSPTVERWLLKARIDLNRRQDVWFLAFRDPYYVFVYLKSGALMYGWPSMTTRDRAGAAAELYLRHTKIWDADGADWKVQEGLDGVWIDAASIERIEFTLEGAADDAMS